MKKILVVLSILFCSINGFAQNDSKKEIEVSNAILTSYVGKYQLGPNAVIDVTKEEKQLFVQLTGQSKFEIFPSSETEFFLTVVEARLVFHQDGKGDVESLTLYQNGRDINGKKIE